MINLNTSKNVFFNGNFTEKKAFLLFYLVNNLFHKIEFIFKGLFL